MRRIPRLAIAGTVAAGILGGCSPSSAGQSGLTYARYTFTCCTASDIQSAWHPGQTVSLHWIVVAAGAAQERPRPPPTACGRPPGAHATEQRPQRGAPAPPTGPAAPGHTRGPALTATHTTAALPTALA